MLGGEAKLFRRTLILLDVAVSALAFWVALYARQWLVLALQTTGIGVPGFGEVDLPLVTQPGAYRMLLVAMLPMWGLSLYLNHTNDFRAPYRRIAGRYARAVLLGLAMLISVSFLLKTHALARSFVVLFGILHVLFLTVARYTIMETVAFLRSKRVDGHRVVVVGCGDESIALAKALKNQPPWNVRLLGHVSVPGETQRTSQPALASVSELSDVLDREPVDEVVFAVKDVSTPEMLAALYACDERGVDVLLPLPQMLPAHSRVEITGLNGFDQPLLGLRRTPSDDVKVAFKRTLDIVGSGILILFSLPVMAVVATAIKASSPGPVFFRQVRAGRHGRRFTMFKFRSMVVDAEARRKELLHMNEMSGPVFKIRRDPRVTRVGAIIRKTSLDELPQLFNIFSGAMSMVGPRPPIPEEVQQYEPWQRRRLSVKPGLTGLWQISGRNDVDFEEWMQMDLRYIDDWSLWLDMKILLRTVPAVIFRSGAS
jgi:exopolysaccharide biosynthesis polyprenyl glycosylphosphotransferase